ncbi:Abi family protein [Actinomyces sp. zg-332]|uniref:Abi family protein n=1 Tax=Actinomyces sp. zg-332 TaxID=2708340 RepID=UPI001423728A|nr:Abi family protein [Actinomyces sp. zg-332]QPK93614.1 Abi family protein [Actinomyces sp. zg-332]
MKFGITDIKKALQKSREDFVLHHRTHYDGKLPIWVAVEIMDWGGLMSNLYSISPEKTRRLIAEQVYLSAPQLESWLKSLNIIRNYVAHHGRVYNRVFDIKPKLPRNEAWTIVKNQSHKLFAIIVMIYYLHQKLELNNFEPIDSLIENFPGTSEEMTLFTGIPNDWKEIIQQILQ